MEVDSIIPHDRYGPLNVWSGNRTNVYNPGGLYSRYNVDGTLRGEDDDSDDEADRRAADMAEWAAAGINDADRRAAEFVPRRSSRLDGLGAGFQSDNDCVGKTDPISLKQILTGFRLEADGRCYDLTTLLQLKPYNNNDGAGHVRRSPFTRAPFTPTDNARLLAASRGGKRGIISKKLRKTTKGKNFRKSKKAVKSKKAGKSKKMRIRLTR
jgi:hypothetical protein